MTTKAPIQPTYGSGQVLSPAAASASATLAKGNKQVILTNTGSNICYIRIGTGSLTATTADYPIPAGAQVVATKGQDDDKLAHISASGTTLHVMSGEGF